MALTCARLESWPREARTANARRQREIGDSVGSWRFSRSAIWIWRRLLFGHRSAEIAVQREIVQQWWTRARDQRADPLRGADRACRAALGLEALRYRRALEPAKQGTSFDGMQSRVNGSRILQNAGDGSETLARVPAGHGIATVAVGGRDR